MRTIKALMYGVGEVARTEMVRLMVEKGVHVVGAISRSSNIGKDLGEVCGLGYPLGVEITNNPEEAMAGRRIDIAVHGVKNSITDSYNQIARCVTSGINVITIGAEMLFPWNSSPVLTSKLDRLAQENGVTVTGSGYQDVYWANMITQLAGTCHSIDSITGTARYNINEFGPEVAKSYFVGDSVEEFNHKMEKYPLPLSSMQTAAESICAAMGLTITNASQRCEPLPVEADTYVKSLDVTVPAGKLKGSTSISEIQTKQGITVTTRLIRTCYQNDELDINRWEIRGFPDVNVENVNPPTSAGTSTTTVNRIPDVINAQPGFITCDKLPQLRYRTKPLHYYLDSNPPP